MKIKKWRKMEMSSKQKPTNVELVTSVSGLRNVVRWLNMPLDYLEMADDDRGKLCDYIDFLKSVLERRDEQC